MIACAAALAARALAPDVLGALLAGHLSTEPGARRALDALGLRPLLDLGLRLGEGSGAALALPVVAAAARVLRDVATFDSAGVSARRDELARPPAGPGPAGPAAPAAPASRRPGYRVLVLGGARSGKSVTAERCWPAGTRWTTWPPGPRRTPATRSGPPGSRSISSAGRRTGSRSKRGTWKASWPRRTSPRRTGPELASRSWSTACPPGWPG